MGASRDDFTKYPRTPHLFGSRGMDDDKHLGQKESLNFIADASLIVEEKLDGTNVGIHFTSAGRLVLQCRGHEITSGRGCPKMYTGCAEGLGIPWFNSVSALDSSSTALKTAERPGFGACDWCQRGTRLLCAEMWSSLDSHRDPRAPFGISRP
jgi:hypothetical protein